MFGFIALHRFQKLLNKRGFKWLKLSQEKVNFMYFKKLLHSDWNYEEHSRAKCCKTQKNLDFRQKF